MSGMTDKSLRFQPPRGATAITLIGLALLVSLGVWQLHRLDWKEALLARIEARLEAPAKPLPAEIADPDRWEYAGVELTGRFLHSSELYLARGRGWQVITPLAREAGPPVLVVRGFVPERKKPPDAREEGLVEGKITITGIARLPEEPGMFVAENQPQENRWFWRDLDAMAAAAGLERAAPVFVEAREDAPGGWPRGGVTRLDIPNRHLGYAITWFALAGALLVVYLVAGYRRAGEL